MRIGIAKRVLATMLAVVALATPMQAEAKTTKTPRYVDRTAVVAFDYTGKLNGKLSQAMTKHFLVFCEDGSIQIFDSELANRFKVGQTVKVHCKTQRTKSYKDDVVLDAYKAGTKDLMVKQYVQCIMNSYYCVKCEWEEYHKH